MKVTQITAGWQETVSLPEYSNIKPSVILTVEIEDDGDYDVDEVMDMAKAHVRGHIDDALEAHGLPPKYYDGPLFQVVYDAKVKVVVIMPNDTNGWPDGYTHDYNIPRGIRRSVALSRGSELATRREFRFLDCSDGDLSPAPVFDYSKEDAELPF